MFYLVKRETGCWERNGCGGRLTPVTVLRRFMARSAPTCTELEQHGNQQPTHPVEFRSKIVLIRDWRQRMARRLIILLVLATAGVHLSFFLTDPKGGWIYALNAVGYLALAGNIYLPSPRLEPFRRPARLLLIAYTALTVALYVVVSLSIREWTIPLGPIDKAMELVLIGLLWRDDRRSAAGVFTLHRAG